MLKKPEGEPVVLCLSGSDIADRGVLSAKQIRGMTSEKIEELLEWPLDHEDATLVSPEVCAKCPSKDSCPEYKKYQQGKGLTLHKPK